MLRKLALSFGPILAVVMLAAFPAISQAKKVTKPPTWTGCKGTGTVTNKCQLTTWGTLTFKFSNPELGSITCKKADGENIWNESPPEGGPLVGKDEVLLMAFYECSGERACVTPTIKALHRPWQSELFLVGSAVHDAILGIELEITCGSLTIIATGTLTPEVVNSKPTFEKFTPATGTLTSNLGTIEVTGIDKMMGFVNEEKIKVVA
jgi:hypothetical protein